MRAAHPEKLFQVLLDVLVLNGEHGGSQLVDSCSQTVDVVVVAWKKQRHEIKHRKTEKTNKKKQKPALKLKSQRGCFCSTPISKNWLNEP